jgi:hypothetical protein
MKNSTKGVAIAAVVLFFWGFLYWGLGPYRTMIWHQSTDDVAAGQALLKHFPENGSYFVPEMTHEEATVENLFADGPVAFVHMISASGRSMHDPTIMIQGFILNLVVIVLIATLLHRVCSALPTYLDRVKFVALAGLIAAVLVDLGDAVWWQIDWSWKLYQSFYTLSACVITGLILAKYITHDGDQAVSPEDG